MNYFLNLKKANAEVERLSAELSKFKDEAKASAESVAAQKELADKADATIADLTAKLAAETAAKEAAVKSQADFDSKVDERAAVKAREIAAAQGAAPINLPKDSPNQSAVASMPRAEFSKLPAVEQMKFCLAGGQIIN